MGGLNAFFLQRVLFLFFMLTLCCCQSSDKSKSQPNVAQLAANYQRLPLQYQDLDFAELFLLKPVAQKIKLKQEFDLVRRRQTFDSLYFSFLGKPFSNFIGSTIARTDIPSTYGDSVEILIRHSQALAPVFDTYYIGITGLQFRRFILDENCNPYTGSKPLTSACFSVLAQKTLPANPNNFAEIKDYLNKCGFSGFPARFNNSCLDGDYVTIYVKNLGQYQVVYVHCPDELHPLRIILNKVKYFLELK